MDITQKAEIRDKIEADIRKTSDAIVGYEEMSQPVAPENSIGRISRMDAINNKSVTEAALRTAKKKLSALQLALSRIDDPDFGVCGQCKNPIAIKRILFRPESKFCVRCAR